MRLKLPCLSFCLFILLDDLEMPLNLKKQTVKNLTHTCPLSGHIILLLDLRERAKKKRLRRYILRLRICTIRDPFETFRINTSESSITEETKTENCWISEAITQINTFAASYLNTQGLKNSCLKSPASTLVDLTFQSRALRSFSLNQLRNLSL